MFENLHLLAMLRLLALITTDLPLQELILNELGQSLDDCRTFLAGTQWGVEALDDFEALREHAFRETGVTSDLTAQFIAHEREYHPHELSGRIQEAQAIKLLLQGGGRLRDLIGVIDQRLKSHLDKVNTVVGS